MKQGLIFTKMFVHQNNEPPKLMNANVANPDLEGTLMSDHTVKFPSPRESPNEYIAYDVAQIKIRYVFMLKWTTSR